MRKLILAAALLAVTATAHAWDYSQQPDPVYNEIICEHCYGYGQHMDVYGRRVELQPQGGQPVLPWAEIEIQDGYGMGTHMDQLGRPVRIVPVER